jgi:hypothetical protein
MVHTEKLVHSGHAAIDRIDGEFRAERSITSQFQER